MSDHTTPPNSMSGQGGPWPQDRPAAQGPVPMMSDDSRKLRKSRKRWRLAAIIAGVVALLALLGLGGKTTTTGPYVARYYVEGMIMDDPLRDEMMQDIADSSNAQALIVRINSPGGTVAGSEALYESIRKVAAKKPVVAVMAESAASGGYITALAADHIIARKTTITGSIGVIMSAPNVYGLMEKVGVKMLELKSGENKAEPSPFQPYAPDSLDVEREMILDTYGWFMEMVRERRGTTDNQAGIYGDGRVFSGRQALKIGLIDAIGGIDEARGWLSEEHGISTDLAIRDTEPDYPDPSFFEQMLGQAMSGLVSGRTPRATRLEAISGNKQLLAVMR